MNLTENRSNLEKVVMNNSRKKFSNRLLNLQKQQFSGSLTIKASSGLEWKIYFCLGRIIWAEGGEHPNRAWRRNLLKYLNQRTNYQAIDCDLNWDSLKYHALTIYLKVGLINREKAINLIEYQINCQLFDVLQYEIQGDLVYQEIQRTEAASLSLMLQKPIALLNTIELLEKSEQDFKKWSEKGLVFISPDFAPIVKNRELLAQKVSSKKYLNLNQLLNGKKSLRDLASLMEKDLLKFSSNLLTYVSQGILDFIAIEDFESIIKINKLPIDNQENYLVNRSIKQHLIVSIDDRLDYSTIIGKIIEKAGYQFLSINDNLNAVLTLSKQKPDLILLDLDMPVINGYDICKQIRRVPLLKNIPIIMLTGCNDPLSKIKAKMSGANSFLTKPTEYKDLIYVLQEYL